MQRIAIDMDDVLADTRGKKLEWYERDFGVKLNRVQTRGKKFKDCVPSEHREAVRRYARQRGFFSTLKVMPDSQEVVRALMEKYEVFIVTAAMPVPNSFLEKYAWLARYFPFIPVEYIVYCGHKYMIQADYLIDDQPYNLEAFKNGAPILYTSDENYFVEGYTRANNWLEISGLLL